MLAISREVLIDLDKDDFEVLVAMIEGQLMAVLDEGDEPSDRAVSVYRKILVLQSMCASCQGSLPRGGDFFDPRVYDIERPGWDKVEKIQPPDLDSDPLSTMAAWG